MNAEDRRWFLTLASTSLAFAACHQSESAAPESHNQTPAPAVSCASGAATAGAKDEEAEDVGAVEDLMREHGIIRRILVVYRECALRLRAKPRSAVAVGLQPAARLLQTFGENYHERLLEEAQLFPALKKAGGAAASLIDPLLAQHQRGREITSYVIATTAQ